MQAVKEFELFVAAAVETAVRGGRLPSGWCPGDSLKLQEASPPEQPQTLSLQEALQQAISHHRAGQLQDAERLYRAILEVAPQQPDANHNLGVLALEVNKPEAALAF